MYLLCAGLVTRLTVLRFKSLQFELDENKLSIDSRETTSLNNIFTLNILILFLIVSYVYVFVCLFLYVITVVQHYNNKE